MKNAENSGLVEHDLFLEKGQGWGRLLEQGRFLGLNHATYPISQWLHFRGSNCAIFILPSFSKGVNS